MGFLRGGKDSRPDAVYVESRDKRIAYCKGKVERGYLGFIWINDMRLYQKRPSEKIEKKLEQERNYLSGIFGLIYFQTFRCVSIQQ